MARTIVTYGRTLHSLAAVKVVVGLATQSQDRG